MCYYEYTQKKKGEKHEIFNYRQQKTIQFKNRSAVEVGKYLRVFQTLILNKCQ